MRRAKVLLVMMSVRLVHRRLELLIAAVSCRVSIVETWTRGSAIGWSAVIVTRLAELASGVQRLVHSITVVQQVAFRLRVSPERLRCRRAPVTPNQAVYNKLSSKRCKCPVVARGRRDGPNLPNIEVLFGRTAMLRRLKPEAFAKIDCSVRQCRVQLAAFALLAFSQARDHRPVSIEERRSESVLVDPIQNDLQLEQIKRQKHPGQTLNTWNGISIAPNSRKKRVTEWSLKTNGGRDKPTRSASASITASRENLTYFDTQLSSAVSSRSGVSGAQ